MNSHQHTKHRHRMKRRLHSTFPRRNREQKWLFPGLNHAGFGTAQIALSLQRARSPLTRS